VQNIRLTNTGFYNGYSSMTFAWDRPNDASNAGIKSCIKAYNVELYRVRAKASFCMPATMEWVQNSRLFCLTSAKPLSKAASRAASRHTMWSSTG
jgi:hypothetical protein